MPQMKPSHLIFTMTMALALAGCGDKNDKASFNPEEGHPVNWAATHKTSANANIESCRECHGESLAGGISQVGCFSTPQAVRNGFACHSTSPLASTGCALCHGAPPNGTTALNRAGAHAKHMALPGVTCDSCHSGGGSGTADHAKTNAAGNITAAKVNLATNLKAKAVTASFGYNSTNGTCSATICHGGQATPAWYSGTISVATGCLKCHEQGTASQTPQYNSFYSGNFPLLPNRMVNLHQRHLAAYDPTVVTAVPIFCTSCHNGTTLSSQHFSGLITPVFEGTAGSSISGGNTKITTYSPVTSTSPSGTCTSQCHGSRNWAN